MKLTIKEMILISLFTSLTAIGAFIKIPTPLVPFTLQFLFCSYAGILLGAKRGLYSQGLYLLIGLIGIPIFANGGGPAYVLQPTFGYLVGFAACSYIIGQFVDKNEEIRFWPVFGSIMSGLTVVYLFGVVYLYAIVQFYLGKEMTLMAAAMVGFVPYITFDIIQAVVIALSSVKILPVLRRSGVLVNGKRKMSQ